MESNMGRLYLALIILAMVIVVPQVRAQEKADWQRHPYALGAGLEINQNTRENIAWGYSVVIDRHLFNRYLLAGLRGSMINDSAAISNFQGLGFFRAYPYKIGLGGAFVQAGFGASSFREDDLTRLIFYREFSAGFRFFIPRGFLDGFYIEAYAGTGYPFHFNLGLLAGHRFSF
jgi:hypothetical protein